MLKEKIMEKKVEEQLLVFSNSYSFLAAITHCYTPQGLQYRLEKHEDLQEIKCHQWPVML